MKKLMLKHNIPKKTTFLKPIFAIILSPNGITFIYFIFKYRNLKETHFFFFLKKIAY
jgi:hypothetical protein